MGTCTNSFWQFKISDYNLGMKTVFSHPGYIVLLYLSEPRMSFFLLCVLVEIIICLHFLTKHFREKNKTKQNKKKNWPLLLPLPTGHPGSHLVSLQGFPLSTLFFILLVSSLEEGNSNPVHVLTCSSSPVAKSAAA